MNKKKETKERTKKPEREIMVQYTIRLPVKFLNRLDKIVKDNQMTYPTTSHLIRTLLNAGIKKIERQSK